MKRTLQTAALLAAAGALAAPALAGDHDHDTKSDDEKKVVIFEGEDGERRVVRDGQWWDDDDEEKIVVREAQNREEGDRPRIGVTLGSVSEALAAQSGVDPDDAVLITRVLDDLPADRAGVKQYDIVVAINGKPPADADRLREVVFGADSGDVISLTVMRSGKKKTVDIKIGAEDHHAKRDRDRDRQRIRVEREEDLEMKLRMQLEEAMKDVPRQYRRLVEDEMKGLRSHAGKAAREAEEALKRIEIELDDEKLRDIRKNVMKSLESVEIDKETMKKIEKSLGALDDSMKEMRKKFEVIIEEELEGELPQLRFFGRGNGEGVIVVPAPPREPRQFQRRAAPGPDGMKWNQRFSDQARETGELSSRLDRLEERMARLEKLLEQLVENER